MQTLRDFLARLSGSRARLHAATLATVWLAVASSGVVFSEPAPVDLLMMLLVGLLPVVGLVRFTRSLVALSAILGLLAALALLAGIGAVDPGKALSHTVVGLYLYAACVIMAGFVAYDPDTHVALVLHAYVCAAVAAAVTGLIGYFDLLPGAGSWFTKFGRAAGTFKDPNVYGAFLVPALLVTCHRALEQAGRARWFALALAGFLALAILLSFSRGAWINAALAISIYGYLRIVMAENGPERFRLIGLAAFGASSLVILVAIATQTEPIATLLSQRASLDQGYDTGPDGRFAGQHKALDLALRHPFGLGPQQFAHNHHHEEPHNVYLNMFLNTGWIGGIAFPLLILVTVVQGFWLVARRDPLRSETVLVTAAFLAVSLEGAIIDLDHWRHVYLMMALIWGIAAARSIAPHSHPARFLQSDHAHPVTRTRGPSIVRSKHRIR